MLAEMSSQVVSVLINGGIILAVALLVGIVWRLWVKPRFTSLKDEADPSESMLSLDSLEKLHKIGTISDEEFKCLRNKTLGGLLKQDIMAETDSGSRKDSPSADWTIGSDNRDNSEGEPFDDKESR